MIRVSVFFIAFFSLTSLYAQKYASVGAWDNVVLYLPVIQGLSSDGSIQMSLLSGKLESVGTPVLFGAPTNRNPQYEDLFNFDPKIPIQANIRNDYFISLQKSFLYDEGSRLSIGLHMHRYTRNKQKIWNDTHFGGTINYHFLINSKKKRSSFISIGYQLNITKRSPNYSVTSTVYNEWFNLTNVIPYQDYVNQFKRFDWHHILGLNYALLVKKRLALNFGSSFELFSQPKYYTASADIRLSSFTGSFSTASQNNISARLNIEAQYAFNNKFVIITNMHILGEGPLYELKGWFGLAGGFRFRQNSLLKIGLSLRTDFELDSPFFEDGFYELGVFSLSLLMKQYDYHISIGTSGQYEVLKFAARYRFNDRDLESLIQLND